jgi:hypothetical protein
LGGSGVFLAVFFSAATIANLCNQALTSLARWAGFVTCRVADFNKNQLLPCAPAQLRLCNLGTRAHCALAVRGATIRRMYQAF